VDAGARRRGAVDEARAAPAPRLIARLCRYGIGSHRPDGPISGRRHRRLDPQRWIARRRESRAFRLRRHASLCVTPMDASDSFGEFVREQLAPLGRVTMRRMFGKTGVFCNGVMLGMVTDNTLYFRVDDDNREAFKEAAAFAPLNYTKKGSTIDLSFWRAPERLFDDTDEFVTWARAALAAA